MNDDLDDLKSIMTTPAPDAARKAANLAAAQEIFDRSQGSAHDARPTSVTGPMALWTGVKFGNRWTCRIRKAMPTPRPIP